MSHTSAPGLLRKFNSVLVAWITFFISCGLFLLLVLAAIPGGNDISGASAVGLLVVMLMVAGTAAFFITRWQHKKLEDKSKVFHLVYLIALGCLAVLFGPAPFFYVTGVT